MGTNRTCERRVPNRLSVVDSAAVTLDESDADPTGVSRAENQVRRLESTESTDPDAPVSGDTHIANVLVEEMPQWTQ